MPRTPEGFLLTQPRSPLTFTARSYGDSFWHWSPEFGNLVWGWDPSLHKGDLHRGDISPIVLLLHVEAKAGKFASAILLPVSMWLCLYILRYGTFVPLDIRQFSLIVAL